MRKADAPQAAQAIIIVRRHQAHAGHLTMTDAVHEVLGGREVQVIGTIGGEHIGETTVDVIPRIPPTYRTDPEVAGVAWEHPKIMPPALVPLLMKALLEAGGIATSVNRARATQRITSAQEGAKIPA